MNMNYTKQQIDSVEQYAGLYLRISDMAVLLSVSEMELKADIATRSTDVSKAYYRGKTQAKLKLLTQEMKLAQVGSPLAVENMHRNLLDMEDDE